MEHVLSTWQHFGPFLRRATDSRRRRTVWETIRSELRLVRVVSVISIRSRTLVSSTESEVQCEPSYSRQRHFGTFSFCCSGAQPRHAIIAAHLVHVRSHAEPRAKQREDHVHAEMSAARRQDHITDRHCITRARLCPVLSCPVLSCPGMSCPGMSHQVTSPCAYGGKMSHDVTSRVLWRFPFRFRLRCSPAVAHASDGAKQSSAM